MGRLLVCFAQNESKHGKIPRITRKKIRGFSPNVVAEVQTLSGLHESDLFISQHGPSGNP